MSRLAKSAGGVSSLLWACVGSLAGSFDVTVHSDHHRCVVNLEQIMCAPKNALTQTVDEVARDGIKRRRRDLVASSSVSWIGELLNVLSRGLLPRVMVTSLWDPLCSQS